MVPSGETGRRRRGPKAELPKALEWVESGEQGVWVLEDEAARGDGECGAEGLVAVCDLEAGLCVGTGAADLSEKVSCWVTGRSSCSARWIEVLVDWPMLLLRSLTEGRAGATVTGRVSVRPSLREKLRGEALAHAQFRGLAVGRETKAEVGVGVGGRGRG